LVKDWTLADHAFLRAEVPRRALDTVFRKRKLLAVARDVVTLAEAGLRRRARHNSMGEDEGLHLASLRQIVDDGKCRAQDQLASYYGRWGESVDPLFAEEAY
jgi:glutamate--cysteine ligase